MLSVLAVGPSHRARGRRPTRSRGSGVQWRGRHERERRLTGCPDAQTVRRSPRRHRADAGRDASRAGSTPRSPTVGRSCTSSAASACTPRLRAMQEALGRPELAARHCERDLPRAGAARPGRDRRRSAARRPQRSRRSRPTSTCPGRGSRVARARRVRRARTTPHLVVPGCAVPEVPRPHQIDAARSPGPSEPVRRDPFHQQTEWLPVSPLDDPGRGRFMSWVRLVAEPRLEDGSLDPLCSRCTATCSGPRSDARSARRTSAVHGAVARDRHPFRRDARRRRGCCRRSRRGTSATATPPVPPACGTKRCASARSRRRPRTSGVMPNRAI